MQYSDELTPGHRSVAVSTEHAVHGKEGDVGQDSGPPTENSHRNGGYFNESGVPYKLLLPNLIW